LKLTVKSTRPSYTQKKIFWNWPCNPVGPLCTEKNHWNWPWNPLGPPLYTEKNLQIDHEIHYIHRKKSLKLTVKIRDLGNDPPFKILVTPLIHRGPKVSSLQCCAAGVCAQQLRRRIRGCDVRIRRKFGAYHANVTRKIRIKMCVIVARVCDTRTSCKCCAHLPREERATRDVAWTPRYPVCSSELQSWPRPRSFFVSQSSADQTLTKCIQRWHPAHQSGFQIHVRSAF
jgi:hypothetical protein